MRSPFLWASLHFPRPLDAEAGLAAIRSVAADYGSPVIVLEARATAGQVTYLLGCPARVRRSVEQRLTTAVPGLRLTDPADKRDPVMTAGQVLLTTRHRPLRTDKIELTTRQILGALSRVRKGELLVIQVMLGPRRVPLAVPNQSPSSVVMTPLQVAWLGNGKTVDTSKREALRVKVGDHGFAATIRLGVTAESADRRRDLLSNVHHALRLGETPGLQMHLVPGSSAHLNTVHVPWRFRLRLNASEVLAFSAWPIGDDDLPGLVPLHPRRIAPAALARPEDRVLAMASAPGVDGALGYSMTDALRHSWTIGPSGTGKSTLQLNLIDQDLRAGRGVVVMEPKDLIRDLLERIPEERQADVVVLDAQDDQPVGLNPLLPRGRRPEVVADGLFSLFVNLYGDGLGPRSSDILLNCLTVLAERDDATLTMIPLLLTNTGFRRSLTAAIHKRDLLGAGSFWSWFEGLSDEARANVTAPISNKLRSVLRAPLRGVLGQRRPRFDIRQVLTEQKILLVPLQAGVLGPATAELLGNLVLHELWLAVRERAALPVSQRPTVCIYLDELQEYIKTPVDLADALATSRSLGAAWHVAHQYRDQLTPSVRTAVMSNARSRICFQLTADDARAMAAGQSVLSPEDFTALPAYHVYASLLRDNSVQPWASGITQPPPPVCSSAEAIRAASRERYGQPLDQIEADFAELVNQDHAGDGPIGRQRRTRS